VTVVRFYEVPLQRLLQGKDGTVARDLYRRGLKVQNAAKLTATSAPKVRTGRYRSSIALRLDRDSRGLFAEIGSKVPYALPLELGTPPRVIVPRRKKALAWPGGGHPVKRVRHPGTRAYRVLTRALRAART
jgi:hypothetical protein